MGKSGPEESEEKEITYKIQHLGSEITVKGLSHYSNAVSLTPGGLDNSQSIYDRFPVPAINISAINRKESSYS